MYMYKARWRRRRNISPVTEATPPFIPFLVLWTYKETPALHLVSPLHKLLPHPLERMHSRTTACAAASCSSIWRLSSSSSSNRKAWWWPPTVHANSASSSPSSNENGGEDDPLIRAALENVEAVKRVQANIRAALKRKRRLEQIEAAKRAGAAAASSSNESPASNSAAAVKKSPFMPSGMKVVAQFLKMAAVGAGDHVLDIGCGDGRVVNAAAKFCGATGVGIDIDESLVEQAEKQARQQGISGTRFVTMDMSSPALIALIKKCTVVFVFMLPQAVAFIEQLLLTHLPSSARVVTYCFALHSWPSDPDKVLSLDPHTKLYLYTKQQQQQQQQQNENMTIDGTKQGKTQGRELHAADGKKSTSSPSDSEKDGGRGTGVTLVPSVFTRRGQDGDFNWMIRQPQYRTHFFIYNDNQEAMLSQSSRAGGGNAIIRPFRAASPPRAWGIPTGSRGQGYPSLNDTARGHIDTAINRIVALCREHGYTHVHYSANRDGSLGTAIFAPHPSVTAYILRRLQESFP